MTELTTVGTTQVTVLFRKPFLMDLHPGVRVTSAPLFLVGCRPQRTSDRCRLGFQDRPPKKPQPVPTAASRACAALTADKASRPPIGAGLGAGPPKTQPLRATPTSFANQFTTALCWHCSSTVGASQEREELIQVSPRFLFPSFPFTDSPDSLVDVNILNA